MLGGERWESQSGPHGLVPFNGPSSLLGRPVLWSGRGLVGKGCRRSLNRVLSAGVSEQGLCRETSTGSFVLM